MSVPVADELLATIRSYPDLVDAFRTVKARLGLSNAWVDEVCGWCEGIADKKLGPSQTKPIGPIDFTTFCQIFAVQLEMRIDLDAVREMEAMWQGRAERNVRKIDSRISKTIIERAKPHVLTQMAKKMNKARNSKLSRELRSKIARKAGKKRMRKVTKAQRSAMSIKGWETRRRMKLIADQALSSTAERAQPVELDRRSSLLTCTKPVQAAGSLLPIAPLQAQ